MTEPTPPAPQGGPAIPLDFVIPIALSVAQINYILSCLNMRPYHEVKDLINSVQGQGDMALASAGYGPNAKHGAAPPPQDPPADDPPSQDPPPPPVQLGRNGKGKKPH